MQFNLYLLNFLKNKKTFSLSRDSISKVNLFLKVNKKNKLNNLHDIESYMVPYEKIKDKIKIVVFKNIFNSETIVNFSKYKYLIDKKDNTIYKAITILRKSYKIKNKIVVYVRKNIPVGSGLGGGSSNAAITLLLMNKLFSLKMNSKVLKKYATNIGCDCLFFLKGEPGMITNFGYSIQNINYKLNKKVLVKTFPKIPILTKQIYTNYVLENKNVNKLNLFKEYLYKKKVISSDLCFNDFEETVFNLYPYIKKQKKKLLRKYSNVILNGSGSSLIIFCNNN